MSSYFYRGRHRREPSRFTQGLAAVAAAVALPAVLAPGVAHANGPDWGPIIACESGGNPTVQNAVSTASGLFQFINGTWAAYGGREFAPTAKQATVEQQYIVANRAFAAEGYRPWNASKSCWGGKIGAGVSVRIKEAQVEPAPKAKARPAKPVKAAAPVAKPVGEPTLVGDGVYTVKPGDTLTNIALDNGTTWQAVFELNRDVVEHEDWIWPGEKLDLP